MYLAKEEKLHIVMIVMTSTNILGNRGQRGPRVGQSQRFRYPIDLIFFLLYFYIFPVSDIVPFSIFLRLYEACKVVKCVFLARLSL